MSGVRTRDGPRGWCIAVGATRRGILGRRVRPRFKVVAEEKKEQSRVEVSCLVVHALWEKIECENSKFVNGNATAYGRWNMYVL